MSSKQSLLERLWKNIVIKPRSLPKQVSRPVKHNYNDCLEGRFILIHKILIKRLLSLSLALSLCVCVCVCIRFCNRRGKTKVIFCSPPLPNILNFTAGCHADIHLKDWHFVCVENAFECSPEWHLFSSPQLHGAMYNWFVNVTTRWMRRKQDICSGKVCLMSSFTSLWNMNKSYLYYSLLLTCCKPFQTHLSFNYFNIINISNYCISPI